MEKQKRLAVVALVYLGLFCIMVASMGCGTNDDTPDAVVDTGNAIAWPAEGECNYYDMGQVGNCQKWLEACTYGGLKCVTTFACNQVYPMGCSN